MFFFHRSLKISCEQVCNKLFFNQTLRFCFSRSTLLSVLKLDLFLYMWERFFLMLFLSSYFFKTYFYCKITSTWVLYQSHNWICLRFFQLFLVQLQKVESAGFPALQDGEFHSGLLSFVTFMENIVLHTVVLHQTELWQ